MAEDCRPAAGRRAQGRSRGLGEAAVREPAVKYEGRGRQVGLGRAAYRLGARRDMTFGTVPGLPTLDPDDRAAARLERRAGARPRR